MLLCEIQQEKKLAPLLSQGWSLSQRDAQWHSRPSLSADHLIL